MFQFSLAIAHSILCSHNSGYDSHTRAHYKVESLPGSQPRPSGLCLLTSLSVFTPPHSQLSPGAVAQFHLGISPEFLPNFSLGISPEFLPNFSLGISPEFLPNFSLGISPEFQPNFSAGRFPEFLPNFCSGRFPEFLPNFSSGKFPEFLPNFGLLILSNFRLDKFLKFLLRKILFHFAGNSTPIFCRISLVFLGGNFPILIYDLFGNLLSLPFLFSLRYLLSYLLFCCHTCV